MATSYPTDGRRRAGYLDRGREALEPLAIFLSEFLKEPAMVGSVLPSSHHMVNRLLEPVAWDRMHLVVEYGPGIGPLTRAALTRMRPDARLVALDTSAGFTRHLRTSISDPRLRPVTASAADVQMVLADEGFSRIDCVLSGVPFSTMPIETGAAIMDATCNLLRHDGFFVAYQVRDAIAPLLSARFAEVRKAKEWRNIPPCQLYWARKPIRP